MYEKIDFIFIILYFFNINKITNVIKINKFGDI